MNVNADVNGRWVVSALCAATGPCMLGLAVCVERKDSLKQRRNANVISMVLALGGGVATALLS